MSERRLRDSDVAPRSTLPVLPGLRYVDSPAAWHDEVLASAMDELRRGRGSIASVKAARLSREQADVLLQFIEDLKDDLERALGNAR